MFSPIRQVAGVAAAGGGAAARDVTRKASPLLKKKILLRKSGLFSAEYQLFLPFSQESPLGADKEPTVIPRSISAIIFRSQNRAGFLTRCWMLITREGNTAKDAAKPFYDFRVIKDAGWLSF